MTNAHAPRPRIVTHRTLPALLPLGLISLLGFITPASAQPDFDQCGVLMQGFECMVFLPDDGGSYQLDNLGGYGDGDYVRVTGTLDAGCVTFCLLPCIVDNTTTECSPLGQAFRRGDMNGDASFDVSDPIQLIELLFVSSTPEPPCRDAADANDDGANDVADIVFMLSNLFVTESPPLPSPHATCGSDPTVDGLDCLNYEACP
ncbi:MAG: DUF5818 domain-containing protein [Planctomycetota bacterium]